VRRLGLAYGFVQLWPVFPFYRNTSAMLTAASAFRSSRCAADSHHAAVHVYQFLGHVASTGVSPVTQWRRQRESRPFFSWLLRHDYIPINPFAKVKNIKVSQKIIQPFSQEGVLRLLACCDPATHKGGRGRAFPRARCPRLLENV